MSRHVRDAIGGHPEEFLSIRHRNGHTRDVGFTGKLNGETIYMLERILKVVQN
jgi:hypothetical protein